MSGQESSVVAGADEIEGPLAAADASRHILEVRIQIFEVTVVYLPCQAITGVIIGYDCLPLSRSITSVVGGRGRGVTQDKTRLRLDECYEQAMTGPDIMSGNAVASPP